MEALRKSLSLVRELDPVSLKDAIQVAVKEAKPTTLLAAGVVSLVALNFLKKKLFRSRNVSHVMVPIRSLLTS